MTASVPPTQVRLTAYPQGLPSADTWAFTNDPLPALRDGDVHVVLSHVSVDPGMRGWITPKRSYMPPIKPGDVMRAFGVGQVVASRSGELPVGMAVSGFTGVQTEAVLPAKWLRPVDTSIAPPEAYLGGLGMTGYTAYFGLLDVGLPEPGNTVVVSSAAGAVGSIVCQIAKLKGCRVIGIAGGPVKRRFLLDTLHLAAAIDYRSGPIAPALAAAAPDGVDVYFDNVGGEALDAVLMQINRHGRIVVCGGISQYADMDTVVGPANYLQLVTQSARMQGFTMRDYMHRIPEAFMALLQWSQSGAVMFRNHILVGIDQFPRAFAMLFAGENHGKLLLQLASTAS